MDNQQSNYQSFISRPEISFWVPIIVAVVSVILAFGSVKTDIALVQQQQGTIIAQNEELLKTFKEQKVADDLRYSNLASRVGTNSVRLTAIETTLDFRRKSE